MSLNKAFLFAALSAACVATGASQAVAEGGPWSSVGPFGGDARAFASEPGNPRHLYLGTTSSWVYESADGGSSWHRLAKLGKGDNLVVDNLLVDEADPKTIYAAVWQVETPGGGIYVSHDGGQHFAAIQGMAGQSVRALAQAPNNPKVFVAGSVAGVFRSDDGGQSWHRITPEGSNELHEVESIAIDPVDSNTIYAGTWHLPWKTTDNGAHWSNIKEGVIDDSDVFSIIIDPQQPATVYASACSGIYKSDNAGALFHKVQGIPSTARRTRVLMQDPVAHNIVYAGTTEGLYKTSDSGVNWSRLTGPDVIINDVYVDPKNDKHLLLATDRSGVLESEDGGANFQGSNTGFSQRQVEALLVDTKKPGTMYAGVLNDKIYGGVFVSDDNGKNWKQESEGLGGRDVFTLAEAEDGTVLAGTSHGLFRLDGARWVPEGEVVVRTEVKVAAARSRKTTARKAAARPTTREEVKHQGALDALVHQVRVGPDSWFAATSAGVYRSADHGATWEVVTPESGDYLFVNTGSGPAVFAARRDGLAVSADGGKNWQRAALPTALTGVRAMTVGAQGSLWVGGREGVWYSDDQAASWKEFKNLPLSGVNGLDYDAALGRVLISSRSSTLVFGVVPDEKTWKWWDAGWKINQVRADNGRLVGASVFDGVVIEGGPAQATTASNTGGAQ